MGAEGVASCPTPRLLWGFPFLSYKEPGQMLVIFKEQMFLIPSYLNQVIRVLSAEVSGEPDDQGGVPAARRPGAELGQ